MVALRSDVLIVGAGFAGVGMARRLMASGEFSFMVIERADRVGGTWRDNTYPGVACDVPADLYRFAELPYQGFSKMLPPGAEIMAYLESAAAPIRSHLHLNTELHQAWWDETHGEWSVRTSSGPVRAHALIVACGRLTQPRRIPEVNAFHGPVMHTAEWDHTTDLNDARVALIGTGASAVQVLPHLATRAKSTVVFQRCAPWILPRDDSFYRRVDRHTLLSDAERIFKERVDHSMRRAARERARQHLFGQVSDATLRHALQPDYEFGCKRVLFSNEFYRTLLRDNVRLEPHAVIASGPSTVESAAGRRFSVDAIVLATGFDTAQPAYSRLIVGRHGRSLAFAWRNGMSAFASVSVHGFPNMFILGGPNSALSYNSAVLILETQVSYTMSAIRELRRNRIIDVRADAQHRYAREIERRSSTAPWTSGCSSWYIDPRNGRQVLLWPGTVAEYSRRFSTFSHAPYTTVKPWTILVALKPPEFSKTRLHLPHRAQLARAFAIDTIHAISAADGVGAVFVITADTSLRADLPQNVRLIAEEQPRGINEAINTGLKTTGIDTPRAALVADLPTLKPEELSHALRLARNHPQAVVADADNLGTTMVSASTGIPLVTRFGKNSFARHISAGFTPLEIPNPSGLRRDFDTADHLGGADASLLGTYTRAALHPHLWQQHADR